MTLLALRCLAVPGEVFQGFLLAATSTAFLPGRDRHRWEVGQVNGVAFIEEVITLFTHQRGVLICSKPYRDNVQLIFNDVAEYVCEKHGITIAQLKRDSKPDVYMVDRTGLNRKFKRKSKLLVDAREEFVKIIRQHFYQQISYPMIADYLGYTNHTSIVHLSINRKAV